MHFFSLSKIFLLSSSLALFTACGGAGGEDVGLTTESASPSQSQNEPQNEPPELDITPLINEDNSSKENKPWEHGKLEVSADGHMLQHEDGTGFFWMADTAWFIYAKMSRNEIDKYLTDRASKGFTVILTNIMSNVWRKNFYGDVPFPVNWYDDKPFYINKFSTTPGVTINPNLLSDSTDGYDYWDHVDYVIDKAAEKGIYIALTLAWSEPVKDFIKKDETIYTEYAVWLAERYKDKPNIFWVNGGDIYHEEIRASEVWDWIANGIKSVDNGHLMSWHGPSSGDYHHDKEWLDFNMIESAHEIDLLDQNNQLKKEYNRVPTKPIVDAETRYEEIEIKMVSGADRITAFELREIAYYQVFSGAFGHTYGHNSIWQVATADEIKNGQTSLNAISTWEEALSAPGAQQMEYLSKLMQSRALLKRLPDQTLIASGDAVATIGDGYAFVYSGWGKPIEIRLGKVSGERVKIWSYNPRDGSIKVLEDSLSNSGIYTFLPEGEALYGNDWVVVIDDLSKGYEKPGE